MNQNQNQISEDELEYFFSGKKPAKKNKTLTVAKYTGLFLVIAVIFFFTINYSAFTDQISFWYHHEYLNDTQSTNQTTNQTNNQNLGTKTYNSNTTSYNIPNFADNRIFIPTISVDAPVAWMVKNTSTETSSALENGAIHLLGTATPGTFGNVFVTAHSSNYLWAPGRYKSLFALLNKLSVGDMVYLKYQNKPYIYKVYEKSIISPNNTSVLNQDQKSILTLMTCTPVGTSLNRLIIKSNQLYPDPKSNRSPKDTQTTNSLPGIR